MNVLVVDDSPIDRRLASALLARAGFRTRVAVDGNDALAALGREHADVVVTDMVMDGLDGVGLVEAVRAHYPDIPVVVMTAHGSEDAALRALQRGAASYVKKRDLARTLAETVRSIVSLRGAGDEPGSVRGDAITRWELGNHLAEVTPLVTLLEGRLARLARFDEASRIQVAVALREAIVNAMLHGNLELPSSLKESDPEAHDALAEERRNAAPYRERRVRVTVTEAPDAVTYVVSDDGPGFDVAAIPDPTDAMNLERTSGRGLFLVRTFMDETAHTDGGRTITMTKRTQRKADGG